MNQNRKPSASSYSAVAAAWLALWMSTAVATTQDRPDPATIERLRRDQDEILRKAERLQALMVRLQSRYEREGKTEQVEFLKEGLAHLERSGILREVAGIREDLQTTAFTEALRKQREVVADLERLLNILLARKSIESIDEQLQQVEAQAKTARQLEQRQQELIEAARETMRGELTPAEQALADQLAQLRDAERREAERNAQQAGTRRPFLESALQQVEALLRQQARLEAGIADEAAGRTPEARAQAFDLGDLSERVRELQTDLREQQQQQQLQKAARDLQQAAGDKDPQALQQARDRVDTLLTNPPRMSAGPEKVRDPEWAKVREGMRAAGPTDTEAGREELQRQGASAEELAERRNATADGQNGKTSENVRTAAERLGERLGATAPTQPEGERAVDAVQQAAKSLADAEQAIASGDTDTANEKVSEALTALDKARARHGQENPDAARNAGRMAADSRAAARELDNAPSPESEEKQASSALQSAAEALRQVEALVENEREQRERAGGRAPSEPSPPSSGQPSSGQPQAGSPEPGQPQSGQPQSGPPQSGMPQSGQSQASEASQPESPQQAAAQSRQQLEAARETLQKALDDAASNNEAELGSAAERQQELANAAQQAGEQLQQAAQNGDVTPAQQQAAAAKLAEAQKRMQAASEKLQQGQQASAAGEQRAAAEAMQDAMDALQENRQLNEEQQQQLAEQAKAQEQLTEDIIQLAKELKERENQPAERAVQEAADASRKAQRAMEEGDAEETQKQQEKARQKLEEASDELEQEQDRYQDLRQEELLFRMKDELTSFLDAQRPITAATNEFQEAEKKGGLSRPARRKVNGLGEEEQALAGKIEFLVTALTDEGNLVYQAVLEANLEDLREIARRLAGRSPDVGTFTTLLQQDVERRSEQLLAALEREQQRREQERQQEQQQQQQQQQKGENKFNPQREKLVSLIAELEMLKQLGQDTGRATEDLGTLVTARGDETISDAEVAMIQRLSHRHAEITKLFQQIKAGVEQALGQMGDEGEQGGTGR